MLNLHWMAQIGFTMEHMYMCSAQCRKAAGDYHSLAPFQGILYFSVCSLRSVMSSMSMHMYRLWSSLYLLLSCTANCIRFMLDMCAGLSRGLMSLGYGRFLPFGCNGSS